LLPKTQQQTSAAGNKDSTIGGFMKGIMGGAAHEDAGLLDNN
jgi:hypothetical protein